VILFIEPLSSADLLLSLKCFFRLDLSLPPFPYLNGLMGQKPLRYRPGPHFLPPPPVPPYVSPARSPTHAYPRYFRLIQVCYWDMLSGTGPFPFACPCTVAGSWRLRTLLSPQYDASPNSISHIYRASPIVNGFPPLRSYLSLRTPDQLRSLPGTSPDANT